MIEIVIDGEVIRWQKGLHDRSITVRSHEHKTAGKMISQGEAIEFTSRISNELSEAPSTTRTVIGTAGSGNLLSILVSQSREKSSRIKA
jgi:hypothetical protein